MSCVGVPNKSSLLAAPDRWSEDRSKIRQWKMDRWNTAHWLADAAVCALIDEANLTPKPALVDSRGPGAHCDMNLDLLHRSAKSLRSMFEAIAFWAFEADATISLREDLGELGRRGERVMMQATAGVNTHRGAIWTLGLLCAATAMLQSNKRAAGSICAQAGVIAALPDSRSVILPTHGQRVVQKYGVCGARGEALDGFRHIAQRGLPTLKNNRLRGVPEDQAQLDALMAIMAELDDTCLLHRGGMPALTLAKQGARTMLALGGVSSLGGFRALQELDRELLELKTSPGGAADLLAGVLFLDSVERKFVDEVGGADGNTGV